VPAGDLRLFVAVLLPDSWLTVLSDIQNRLHDRAPRLRYVRPEGIHLTLKFLGEVSVDRVAAIERALDTAASRSTPFTLSLGSPGIFGPPRRPRVVWIGIDGDRAGLGHVQQEVETAMASVGFRPDERGFSPHLTIARVPERLPSGEVGGIAGAVQSLSAPASPPHTVTSFALMRSELGHGGARYTALIVRPLGQDPSAADGRSH
jgi:2'-5' RNA ligase